MSQLSLPHDSFQELHGVHLESFLLFPDVQCSFLFLLGIHLQTMPYSFNGVGFEMVGVHFVSLILAPSIEYLGC